MNNVSLVGRLTADPEVKHTQNGTAYTRFNVAVDRQVKQGEEKQADFINCVAWDKKAEFICKYFSRPDGFHSHRFLHRQGRQQAKYR